MLTASPQPPTSIVRQGKQDPQIQGPAQALPGARISILCLYANTRENRIMAKTAANRFEKRLAPESPMPGKGMKRVSFYLPEPLYEDLIEFANERGETMTGLFRWAFGLSKTVWDEVKEGNRIRVATKDGKMIKEFLITP